LSGTRSLPIDTLASCWMAMASCFGPSGIFSGLAVSGSCTGTPFTIIGVTTMKMISSTRQTSTRGVTLMSALRVFSVAPGLFADPIGMGGSSSSWTARLLYLQILDTSVWIPFTSSFQEDGSVHERLALALGGVAVAVAAGACTSATGATNPAGAARGPADLVFIDGAVYTVDAARSWATAVAVRGERIVYVGDDGGARKLVGAGTRVIDLQGRMLLPGFIDSHVHPGAAGVSLSRA